MQVSETHVLHIWRSLVLAVQKKKHTFRPTKHVLPALLRPHHLPKPTNNTKVLYQSAPSNCWWSKLYQAILHVKSRDVPEGELRVKTPAETGALGGKRNLGLSFASLEMGVSKNRGTPKWMVYFMETPIIMNDLGVPLFLETPKWSTLDSSCS